MIREHALQLQRDGRPGRRGNLALSAWHAAAGQIVHIGNDREETNIGDLAKLVLRVADASPAIAPEPAPAGSVTRRCPDLSRLRALTGYEPAVTLEEGVRSTFAWYARHGRPS